jgi:hypothetical protein
MKKIIVIGFLGLVACGQTSQSDEQISVNRSTPNNGVVITSTVPTPAKEPFTASITVPNQVKLNDEFIVEAILKNLSDNELSIQHAAGVFYFSIEDRNGKRINSFGMKDVGINRTIHGKGTIAEHYTYKLDKPGFYEVSATAKFMIGEGDHKKTFEVETNKANFEVIQN